MNGRANSFHDRIYHAFPAVNISDTNGLGEGTFAILQQYYAGCLSKMEDF